MRTIGISPKSISAKKIIYPHSFVDTLLKQTPIQKTFRVKRKPLTDVLTIHLAVIGHGTVGGTFIEQVLKQRDTIYRRKNIDLRIFAVANTQQLLLKAEGISTEWRAEKQMQPTIHNPIRRIVEFAHCHKLENLIMIDNTASKEIALRYAYFAENGFDIVSSNKIANTLSAKHYKTLRQTLNTHHKRYYYETNVGAGLPLIDTIRLLHLSGENITCIKGIFSGSLSYIFNRFSQEDTSFSAILHDAIRLGYTEPDPREDLCGNDVARKLLVLARELDFDSELEDIEVFNLVPKPLRKLSFDKFLMESENLNAYFDEIKKHCPSDHVLRYIGELHWDLEDEKGSLEVKLTCVPRNSVMGQLKDADSIFEIFTDSYGANPLVIQGAGAGAEVTARGVFGDVLRLISKE